MAARVCIITPGALGSNPRVVKEAEALDAAGYEVTVVATRTLALVEERDLDVLRSAHWQPRRLDFRSRRKWRVQRMIQLGAAKTFATIGLNGLADRGVSTLAGALVVAAKRVAADLYIAHYPAALPAAAIAARRHGARYAFDAEDFHPGDEPEEPAYASQRRIIQAVENRYLSSCAYVSAASPGIADAYVAAYGIERPMVVLNVFPRAQAPDGPTTAGSASPRPTVYWFSQAIGPNRGLECAVRAIGRSQSRAHLHVRGSATGFVDWLRAIAAEVGVSDRLHFLPPAVPSEMASLASAHDVGFVGETGYTPNRRIALTNKLFTYLLAGLPWVMSDVPAHRAFAPEVTGAARLFPVDDPDGLAGALDNFLGDSNILATARAAAYRLGQTRFNWDIEKKRLLERVGLVLSDCVGVG